MVAFNIIKAANCDGIKSVPLTLLSNYPVGLGLPKSYPVAH